MGRIAIVTRTCLKKESVGWQRVFKETEGASLKAYN